MERLLTKIGKQIAGSSDVIIKMDTDELLTVYDKSSNMLSPNFIKGYLSGFVGNEIHPLRLNGNSRVGYLQTGHATEDVCRDNLHPPLDQYRLGDVVFDAFFKMVYESKTLLTSKEMVVNIGGHAFPHNLENEDIRTQFGIVHMHSRCVEIHIENCKRVLERSNYISPSDTDEEAKIKLAAKFKCSPVDMCNTCSFDGTFESGHKAVFFLQYLDCEETYREQYYGPTKGDQMKQNVELVRVLHSSNKRFKLSKRRKGSW